MWKILNICLLFLMLMSQTGLHAQSGSVRFSTDSTSQKNILNTRTPLSAKKNITDSTALPDSLHSDNTDTLNHTNDTLHRLIPTSSNALTDIVHYKASDSITLDVKGRKAQLHNNGVVEYDGMELKADVIHVDFGEGVLYAQPGLDSAGKATGYPIFKQGNSEYIADTIRFNYNSKKGIITGVIAQEGEGFLHGTKVKKMNDSVMYLNSGLYTTCNHIHPHYALNFTKSKLITGDKIVTGPAYVTVEDVPTPLVLPFAFFPITEGRTSGIIIPSYGWMNNRGYYLKDGGYYWAMNDNLDLTLLGDIYTNLSWALEAKSNYYRRYKYKGNFDIRYGITQEGIKGDPNTYQKYSDFKITWRHEQDAKANPYSRFSADVNLQSRNYNKNTSNQSDYFNSTTTSSISYSAKLGNSFNLAASMRESFNASTGLIDIKLPSLSINSVTLYPFRRKQASGSYRWYENISFSYTLNADNNVAVQDSLLFTQAMLNKMNYGIKHSIPISSSVKVFKVLNWTNSINYNERWHWSTIRKSYDTLTQRVTVDTIRGFRANRDISFSSSLNTRIYGTFNFKKGWLRAIRHVINPSVSLSYRPNFGSENIGWWQSYTDNTGYVHRYSIFEHSLYGGPSDGASGLVSFSIGNNLEAKVANKKDTVTGMRKIVLIENLNLAMSYDLAKDSLQWSDFTITGRTTLFKKLIINYSGSFCPYYTDSLGRKHQEFIWDREHKLFQMNNSTWSAQFSISLNPETFKSKGKKPEGEQIVAPIMQSPYNYNPALLMGTYADFSMPWNVSLNYTLSYVSTYVAAQYNLKHDVIQTLSVSGNVNITPNWRVAISTGYDFVNKGMSYTSIDIYRDLHCWEMRFNWVPFGYYKSWNFQINVKAPALKDVKYEKKQSYQDNQKYYVY